MLHGIALKKHIMKIKEEEKLTFEETAKRFGVSIRSLFRWQRHIEPNLKRHKPPTKIDEEHCAAALKNILMPTCVNGQSRSRSTNSPYAKLSSVWASPVKKCSHHPKADPQARVVFRQKITDYTRDNKEIYWIDESAFAADMPRRNGYSQHGERCFSRSDRHEKSGST